MMRLILAPMLFLFAATVAAEDPKPPSPAEKLAVLKKKHMEAETAYRKAAQALPDTPEGQKQYEEIWKKFDAGQAERFMAAYEIAKADPKAEAALAALEWVLTNPRAYQLPVAKPAFELATDQFAANPKVGKIAAWVGYYHRDTRAESYSAGEKFLQAVAEKNPDRAARGQAVMASAWKAGWKFSAAEYQKSPDAEKLALAAEKAFEAVIKDYADCPRLMRDGQPTLGVEAKQELFEIRNLRIGKTAPDIEGDDLDGVKFKLSEYRGKVVVLDFWGDW